VDKDDSAIGRVIKKYRKISSDNPEAKLALDMAPFSGVATSLADAAADAYEGNYVDAGLNLLGVVPGVKIIKGVGAIKNAAKFAGPMANLARTTDRTSDVVTYGEEKTNEPAKNKPMKKGGMTASIRADGIASRGKTKGRIV